MIPDLIRSILAGDPVDPAALEDVLHAVMRGTHDPVAIGGLLIALESRPVEAALVAAAARAMRAHRVAIRPNVRPLVDTCGTGGDSSGTFNISTTAAFAIAGAGVRVAKHGNRAMTSKCGSADLLEGLGVRIEFLPDFEMTELEALFHEGANPFLPYLLGDDFPSDLRDCPEISNDFATLSVAHSIMNLNGKHSSKWVR